MANDTQDIGLDPETWDWATVNGDLKLVGGREAVTQNVAIRLKFLYGEWTLAPGEGVKYRQVVFVKTPNFGIMRQEFRRAIEGAPGVVNMTALLFSYVGKTRALNVTWGATTDTGELIGSNTPTPGR